MLQYLWKKNKKVCKVALVLMYATIFIGALFIVDTIQKEKRLKSSNAVELTKDTGEIPSYDVSGMTDEEILEFIKELRKNEK